MKKLRDYKQYKSLFLALFAFFLGCMLTLNLTPIDKTCIVDDTDREYNIMKNSKLLNPELIILILSASKNLDKRSIIRSTWLKLGINSNSIGSAYKFKHYFVIGSLGLNMDETFHLSSEQSEFQDILILPMYDSYENLSEKVLKSFIWLDEQFNYGLEYKYVLKCDDDSFVNLHNLLIEIPKMETTLSNSNLHYSLNLPPEKLNSFISVNVQNNNNNHQKKTDDGDQIVAVPNNNNVSLYWGYFNGNAKIKKAGKWKETDWIICDTYLPYALGGGYILSKNLITYLAKNSEYFRTFKSEDVNVGLWLSPVTNLIRIHDIRFDTEWITRGCKNYHLISHKVSAKLMQEFYENLETNKRLCTKEEEKRKFYIYNWKLPTSQCCN